MDDRPASPAPARPAKKRRSAVREIVQTILLTLIIFLTVRALVQNFKVEGHSMEPSLHDGQYLFVNKAEYFYVDLEAVGKVLPFLNFTHANNFYLFHPPQRGDVIVFRLPRDQNVDLIKRVIGEPGDEVSIKSGKVYINGQLVDEPFIANQTNANYGPVRVPDDQFFVLGDNRPNSSDSRVWGFVPRDNIIGKAMLSYWPLNEWGWAPNYALAVGKDK